MATGYRDEGEVPDDLRPFFQDALESEHLQGDRAHLVEMRDYFTEKVERDRRTGKSEEPLEISQVDGGTLHTTVGQYDQFFLDIYIEHLRRLDSAVAIPEKKKRFWQRNPIDIVEWEDGVLRMGPEEVVNTLKFLRDVRIPELRRTGTLKEERGAKTMLSVLKKRAKELGVVEQTRSRQWRNPTQSYSRQEVLDAFERLRKTQSLAKKKRIRSLVKSFEDHQEATDKLIDKAHRLWDAYYARPTKAKFQAFLRHKKAMERAQEAHRSIRVRDELKNMEKAVGEARARHSLPSTTTRRAKTTKKSRKRNN